MYDASERHEGSVLAQRLDQLVADLRTHSTLGNKARVVQLCGQIAAIDPDNPDLLITTGLLAWRHGKREEAEALMRQAAARHPNEPECLSSLADILAARGNHAEAIAYYRQSAAMRPGHANTLLRAARTMRRAGDVGVAISMLSEALARPEAQNADQISDVWRELASLYLYENKVGDALAALESARGVAVPGAEQANVFRQGGSLWEYCQSHGIAVEVLDDLAMSRMTNPEEVAKRPAFAAGLEDVQLLGTSFVPVTNDGFFFAEGLVPNPEKIVSPMAGFYNDVVQVSDGVKILAAASNEEAVAGTHFFVGFHENFGHWMLNIFSRLMMAARIPHLRSLPLVVGRGVGPMHFDCLARAGYNRDRIRIVEPDTVYRFERLWMPSMLYHGYRGELYWSAKIVDYVRETLSPARPRAARPDRRFYIARRNARWRQLVNEDAVIDLVESNGFEVIDPATYSIAEQTELAAQAEIIMGPAGAGMMLLLFARPGTRVVEMIYDFPAMDIHPTICRHLGLHYHRVTGEAVKQGDDPLNHDFEVPIDDVERVLEDIFQMSH